MQSRIKDAALELFAIHGYESTTMREIGKKVGIRGSSIYSHYNSKEELFLILVNNLFEKMVWENEENINASYKSNNNLKTFLLEVYKNYYMFFAQHELELLFWQRIRFFSPSGMKGKYDVNSLLNNKPLFSIYLKLFQEGIITKQLKEYNVELLLMAFFAFISGQIDSLIIVPFQFTETQMQDEFDIFWEGIRYRELILT